MTCLQVNGQDDDDDSTAYAQNSSHHNNLTPSSPPPSFRSRTPSPSSRLLHDESHRTDPDPDQTLADTFGDGSDSDEDDEPDDRQRLMRANPPPQSPTDSGNAAASSSTGQGQQQRGRPDPGVQRRPTAFPSFGGSGAGPGRVISSSNDGVFANLDAKPERGEKNDDLPPVCICFCLFCLWV